MLTGHSHREATVKCAEKVFWLSNGELPGGMTHVCFLKQDKVSIDSQYVAPLRDITYVPVVL